MAEKQFDFAILGSSPLAALLALRIAESGARAVLAGHRRSPLQLAGGLDVSAGPITRPETWGALGRLRRDTRVFVDRHFPMALGRIALELVARGASGKQALGHIRNMASAFGITTETRHDDFLGTRIILRGVERIDRRRFRLHLEQALKNAGIVSSAILPTNLVQEPAGMRIEAGAESIFAASVIVVGDALAPFLGQLRLPGLLAAGDAHTFLTLPGAQVRRPFVIDAENGSVLQVFENGQAELFCPGPHQMATSALSAMLCKDAQTEVIGVAQHKTVRTVDGAPVVRRPEGSNVGLVAGFEPFGAFLAPGIADYLLGEADAESEAFFERLGPANRKNIADFTMVLEGAI